MRDPTPPTGFDPDVARRVLRMLDRDEAPFFAGRQDALAEFDESALQALEGGTGDPRRATVFRIFQGAPGAGKSSLLNRIREDYEKAGHLFVQLVHRDFLHGGGVLAKVDKALARRNLIASTATEAVKGAAQFFRAKDLATHIDLVGSQAHRNVAARQGCIVLALDEAQELDESCRKTLIELHIVGLDVPSVLLLTGLPHTEENLHSLDGLSRAAMDSTSTLGALPQVDCVASVNAMLDAVGIAPDAPGRKEAAERGAAASMGWPQHLHFVHRAMAGELLRTNGSLSGSEFHLDAVEVEVAEQRASYYEKRLIKRPMNANPDFTREVLVAIDRERPRTREDLIGVCEDEMKHTGRLASARYDVSPKALAEGFIRSGIILADGQGFRTAVPSMATWAQELVQQQRRSAEGVDL